MDRNMKFLNEHGNSIINTLCKAKLSSGRLEKRIQFMRTSFKDEYASAILDRMERKMLEIIQTGKDRFSREDIDIILHDTLDLELREYDKSHIIDTEQIVSVNAVPNKTAITYSFADTKITQYGTLTYKDMTGVEDIGGLPYYKIDVQDKKGKISTYKIFSHINIEKMETDVDYRSAVLEVLLDEKNMTKTNCGGYIGSIEPVEVGKSSSDTVKANSKYSLVFDSTEASAVVKLRNKVKNDIEKMDEGR